MSSQQMHCTSLSTAPTDENSDFNLTLKRLWNCCNTQQRIYIKFSFDTTRHIHMYIYMYAYVCLFVCEAEQNKIGVKRKFNPFTNCELPLMTLGTSLILHYTHAHTYVSFHNFQYLCMIFRFFSAHCSAQAL